MTKGRPALYRMDDDADYPDFAPTTVAAPCPVREETLLMASAAPRGRAISSPHIVPPASPSGTHPVGFAATIPATPVHVRRANGSARAARRRILLVAVTSFVGTLLIALPLYFLVVR